MQIFTHPEFDRHEQLVFCKDPRSGLKAIIAIHNTHLGPALGGCRMYPYASEAEAVNDVLRLSRGMTYKSAVANLPLGGGKSVIIGDPRREKNERLMQAMGEAVERLGGRYIVAEDSGTSVADIQQMAKRTAHVSGIAEKQAADGSTRSGDPSPMTAWGTFVGIRAAVREQLGQSDLEGIRVAIQGVGNVGTHLARHLHDAGAQLVVCDTSEDATRQAAKQFDAQVVDTDTIFDQPVDVFSPCALGAVINDRTLPRLHAKIVAGAANNQLATPAHGEALRQRGILYAPDYVINAGGVIDVCYERLGEGQERIQREVDAIADTLAEIFEIARREQRPTHEVADRIAESRFLG